jgi:hypothetical protein
MPQEIAEARNDHFNNIAKTQMESVDILYFFFFSLLLPKGVFERKTRTSFGKDS